MNVRRGILLAMLAGLCVAPGTARAAGSLDGTKWQITITPDAAAMKAGEKPSEDTLIFQEGQVTSTECVPYGFEHSSYTMSQAEAAPTFETEQVSEKEGTMTWWGQVVGDTINGTAVWTKKNGDVLHSTFTGKRAQSS